MPLRYGSRVAGVIVVSKLGLNQFDEDDVRLLEVLAGHAAVAVENASLYESARREAESATQLLEFGRELSSASSLEDILERVVELTATLIDSPRTSVWIEDEEGWLIPRKLHGLTGEEQDEVAKRRFHVRDAGGHWAAGSEPFVLGPGQYTRLDDDPLDPGASYAIAPFAVAKRIGCIVAALPGPDFGERELRLLGGLAHQAQLAIANASNYEGLEQTFVSTVEALANALEANDEYTSMHARWITDLALRVGDELELDKIALKRLELGALLHDIGKIGIPSEILSKPGRLTAEERALIETHPELGERIIAPIDRLAGSTHDRPPLPRALGRRRLPGRDLGRRGPARVAHHLRLRRVPRDDDRSPVPQAPEPSGGGAPPARGRRARSSTAASSRSP